jgi:hypothetical protein
MPMLLAKNASVLVTMDDGRRELSNAGGMIDAHNRFALQFAGHS